MRAILLFYIFTISLPCFSTIKIFGEQEGYVLDVEEEKNTIVYEVFVPKPREKEVQFVDILFDSKITTEIRQNYKRQFGATEFEQNYYVPNKFENEQFDNGVRLSVEENVQRQKSFGEYMTARLTEYHLDNYMRESPNLKEVYETKERLSKASLKSDLGYELNFYYSLSGNYMDFKVVTPIPVMTKLVLQMDRGRIGPSEVIERTVHLGYNFNKKLSLESYYKIQDGVFSVVGTNRLTRNLSTSVTASTYTHELGESEREKLLLLGFSYTH